MDNQDRAVSARSEGISVELKATSLYEHSLIRLTAKGCESFELEFDEYITVFAVEWGRAAGDRCIESTQEGGQHVVRAELQGCFAERIIRGPWDPDGSQYGQRYWPYVSSRLVAGIAATCVGISTVELALGAPIRAVGNVSQSSTVAGDTDEPMPPIYAAENEGWRHLYRWAKRQRVVYLDIQLRLGGALLGRLVPITVYTWLAALVGIAVAASHGSATTTATAVAALSAFALREWSATERPQRLTPLGIAYAAGAVLAIGWAIAWRADDILGFALTPLMLTAAAAVLAGHRHFENTGELPRIVELLWSRTIRGKNERYRQADPVWDPVERWTRSARTWSRGGGLAPQRGDDDVV